MTALGPATDPHPTGAPAGPRTSGHPLDVTLADGTVHERWFQVRVGRPMPTWAAAWADPAAVRAAVVAEADRYGSDALHVGASFVLGRAAWRLLGPLMVSYLATDRVPLLTPDTVGAPLRAATGATPGREATITLGTSRFATLPGDPDAGHRDAVVVTDRTALRLRLRRTAETLLERPIAALRPWARRSEHTQWGAASDAVATALWWAGEALGAPSQATTELGAILDGTSLLWGRANLRTTTDDSGGHRMTRTRTVCCFAYQLEAARLCATCPLACTSAHDPRPLMRDA